jgi:hypothetical protein
LPAFVLIKAFTPGYFAREDTRTPMIFAAISVAVNVSIALWLFPSMGAPAIAVASIIAGWGQCLAAVRGADLARTLGHGLAATDAHPPGWLWRPRSWVAPSTTATNGWRHIWRQMHRSGTRRRRWPRSVSAARSFISQPPSALAAPTSE